MAAEEYVNAREIVEDGTIAGEIKIKCSDLHHSRTALEIASSVGGGSGPIIFGSDGFYIAVTNSTYDIKASFTFFKSGFPNYLITTGREDEVYQSHIKYGDLAEICKSAGKKEYRTIQCQIMSSGGGYIIPNIIVRGPNKSIDNLPCITPQTFNEPSPSISDEVEEILKAEPRAKVTLGDFSKYMAGFKTRKCTTIVFECIYDGVMVWGLKGEERVKCCKIPYKDFDGMDDDTEDARESDHPPQTDESGYVISTAIMRSYSVSINFKDNKSWLNKIGKLSLSNGVISIFIKEGYPLIFSVPIGCGLGRAVFEFMN